MKNESHSFYVMARAYKIFKYFFLFVESSIILLCKIFFETQSFFLFAFEKINMTWIIRNRALCFVLHFENYIFYIYYLFFKIE